MATPESGCDAAEAKDRALTYLRDAVRMQTIADRLAAPGDGSLTIFAGGDRLAKTGRLGVMAGSYNPPTLAHLALAQAALEHGDIELVLWCFSRVTVNKSLVMRASLAQRIAVLQALGDRLPAMAVAVIDAGLYADQARILRTAIPEATDHAFILGFDKILQIVDPNYYGDRDAALGGLFSASRLLVAPRAGEGETDLNTLFASPPQSRYRDRVRALPLDPRWQDVASTTVRERIAQGIAIADLVPPEAAALIEVGGYR